MVNFPFCWLSVISQAHTSATMPEVDVYGPNYASMEDIDKESNAGF